MSTSENACIKGSLPQWQILLLGQIVSMCYFGGSVLTSSLENKFGFFAPNFTAFSISATLSLFLIPLYFSRRTRKENKKAAKDVVYKSYLFNLIPLRGSWKAYAMAGLVDYAATFFCNISLQFTSLTSYTILQSLVTPAAMLFSKCFLNRKYHAPHLIGVLLCIVGVIINVIQDNHDDQNDQDTTNRIQYKIFGDLMAVASSFLYGLLDIICEYTLDEYEGGAYEFLGVSAFFSALFAIGPALFWEWDLITSITPAASADLALLVLVDVGSYFFCSKFLQYSEAALLNLSTLTVNVWAVLFSIVLQKVIPARLFFVGLVFTMAGMVIYESSPSPIVLLFDETTKIDIENIRYERITSSNDEPGDVTISTTCSEDSL